MRDAIITYFNGEKNAGLVIAGIGIVALGAAVGLFPAKWGVRSFAITLGVFALIELAIGIGLYVKTGPQVAGLLGQLDADPTKLVAAEAARMTRVQKNFVMLEWIWMSLIPIAAITAVVAKHRFWLSGIALALLVNVAVVLAFDLIAERRGAVYLVALTSSPSQSVSPSPP
jgi:hypothetical protein